ncbi:beta-ketoacyl synthase [Stachybotrys elegans]|uniref:Beta-ketoacyl synthase n=1 Tax=Stachybotrys elegans TaxID=80388 RepID=A0A8K0SCA1_9HYPO|nr:beta-ketoacyl synthase [Stachybotrys elegans]
MVYDTHNPAHHVTETSGVCTGVVPALLAASFTSYTTPTFLHYALEGFRLVFWVSIRDALWCKGLLNASWRDAPWVLSAFGLLREEMEVKLTNLAKSPEPTPDAHPHISAIFDDTVLSINGPWPILEELKTSLSSSTVQFRVAHIHGYYHGGSKMDFVLNQVLNDMKERNISFITWDMMKAAWRSSSTGCLLTERSIEKSLVETALSGILVDVCDWKKTREELSNSIASTLDVDPNMQLRVICMGSGSHQLVRPSVPSHSRLSVVGQFSDAVVDTFLDAVAIVGLSVNYPSGNGKDEFWETLKAGVSHDSEIPASRFDLSQYDGTNASKKRKLTTRYGNFLENPFEFDAAFFNISPREARSMDPQQRLVMQAALDALEDSGYAPNSTPSFQNDSMGVYIGVATGDYVDNLRDEIDVYYSPGTLRAFLSGRISYAFGWHGPSMVLDTACSGSLVALHQACKALNTGDCTTALAGGVNVVSSPDMYLGLSRAHFLSSTGQCKPFDEGADGYCRAEGCGIVVLKKLSQAVAENDQIYGVIRGIGVNQCGTAKSITHPHSNTQAALFRQVLKTSKVDANSINLVEAHGTGTQAGDYAEISSLTSVFGHRASDNPLTVSSVKGSIGHAEAASGLAGLVKLLLMIQEKKILPQASFRTLNPRLSAVPEHNFVIPTKLADWKPYEQGLPRRAFLENFGAAGSNAALVLEEYLGPSRNRPSAARFSSKRSCHVLNLSAKTEQALETLRSSYLALITDHPETSLEDICYTATARRLHHSVYRLSASASNLTELSKSLREAPIHRKSSDKADTSPTTFIFSGQGGAYPGMGAELLSTSPVFRAAVDECDAILSQAGFRAVQPYLKGIPQETDDVNVAVTLTQCAIFVLEYALAKLWMSFGVVPEIVIGHSIGEYAAWTIAGSIDLKDALLLLARRAQLLIDNCPPNMTGMATCKNSASDLQELAVREPKKFAGLQIACLNSPEDVVIAGPTESLASFLTFAKEAGIKAKQLPVPYGFHSAALDPILEELQRHASSLVIRRPTCRVASSLLGRLVGEDEDIKGDYFVRHTREPVRFSEAMHDLMKTLAPSGGLVMLEVGPSPSTHPMVKNILKDSSYTFAASLKPTEQAWVSLVGSLRTLFLERFPIQWRSVYDGTSAKFYRDAPKYPLAMKEYLITYQERRGVLEPGASDPPERSLQFVSSTYQSPSEDSRKFSTPVSCIDPLIKSHAVGGVPLCPASVYMEIVLESVALSSAPGADQDRYILEDMVFEAPLVSKEGTGANNKDVETLLNFKGHNITRFTCSSQGQLHCSGFVSDKSSLDIPELFARRAAFIARQKATLQTKGFESESELFTTKTIYQAIFPRVVAYGEPFLTIKQLVVSPSGLEGSATFRLPSTNTETYVCHPSFVDTLLHAAGFIANMYVPSQTACICVQLERAIIPPTSSLDGQTLQLYCSLIDVGHSIVADAYAMDLNSNVIASVEGMSFKKIPLKSFSAHLSRLVSSPVSERVPPSKPKVVPTGVSRERVGRRPDPKPANASGALETKMREIVSEACGAEKDAKVESTLEELGVDSLMFIEIIDGIRNRFPDAELDESVIRSCITLGDLVQAAIRSLGQESSSGSNVSTPELTSRDSSSHQRRSSPTTPVSTEIVDQGSDMVSLFQEVCGLTMTDDVKGHSLATLGVDSLLSIELSHALRSRHGFVVEDSEGNLADLTFHKLEALFHDKVRRRVDIPVQDTSTQPVRSSPPKDVGLMKLIQSQSRGPPTRKVCLFHDGSGVITHYARIRQTSHTLYGIASPYSSGPDSGIETLEDLATFYIEHSGLADDDNMILAGTLMAAC